MYSVFDPQALAEPAAVEAAAIFRAGLANRSPEDLQKLLGHANMRVRLDAQFALVEQGLPGVKLLAQAAQGESSDTLFARLHGVWGLGILARSLGEVKAAAVAALRPLLEDSDAEIRAQAADVLADSHDVESTAVIIQLLSDDVPRVRARAAIGVGKLQAKDAVAPLIELLDANNNEDPVLRHGAVMGLVGTASAAQLAELINHPAPAVRMGGVLALRRLESPQVAAFLNDTDPLIVEEAVRAIHDVPIPASMPQLAALIDRSDLQSDAHLRRVLNANFRLGKQKNAVDVAQFAARASAPDAMRLEALQMLADWAEPSPKDRVLNMWRPLDKRPMDIAPEALLGALPVILAGPDEVRAAAAQTAAKLGLKEIGPELVRLFEETTRPDPSRVAALEALASLPGEPSLERINRALADKAPLVRATGLRLLAQERPAEALGPLTKALASGSTPERQAALASLTKLDAKVVDPLVIDELLGTWLDRLVTGDVSAEVQLDLISAAESRDDASLKSKLVKYRAGIPKDDPLAAYRPALAGGDAARGGAMFYERSQLSCVRCHTVSGRGGAVGPELTKIGSEKTREYLLESIVAPNRTIAKGFQSETLALDDGRVISGVLKDENDAQVRLVTPEGRILTFDKDAIEARRPAKSPMPEDFVKHVSLFELRDLIEFLASQKPTP